MPSTFRFRILFTALCTARALAQHAAPSFSTIHPFAGAPGDGAGAYAPIAIGGNGVLYGTTSYGGALNRGVIFSLTPPTPGNSAWVEALLYSFAGGTDGAYPSYAGWAIGPGGVLYGTTTSGGSNNQGTVYSLTPPTAAGGAWTEAVLYSFTGGSDGESPFAGVAMGAFRGPIWHDGIWRGIGSGDGLCAGSSRRGRGRLDGKRCLCVRRVRHDSTPYTGLTVGSDGTLYGVTEYGGAANAGTVFCP